MSDLGLIDCFCVLTWSAAMQISCKKEFFLHIKEFNIYRIFFLFTNMAAVAFFIHQYGHRDVMGTRST